MLVSSFLGIVIAMLVTVGLFLVMMEPDAGGAADEGAQATPTAEAPPSGADSDEDEGDSVIDRDERYVAVGVGLLAGLAYVLGNALLFRNHTSPDHMNPRQYGELRERWTNLNTQLGVLCPPRSNSVPEATACAKALAERAYIAEELGIRAGNKASGGILALGRATKKSTGGRWALGSGFVDLWVRLHDAEAALYALQTNEQVVANGLFDELRLLDSGLANSDLMLAQVRGAVTALGGKDYLVSTTGAEGTGGAGSAATTTTLPPNSPVLAPEAGARLVLANIRRTINGVRDASRAGLLETRNYLIWTGMVTGLVTFTVLALAIMAGITGRALVAASAFFLVGALVGLFSQLHGTSGETTRSGEDDFGLARSRLVYVPVLSGLAGIGGVLVMAMLYPVLGVTIDVEADTTGSAVPLLADIFDLSENAFGLLIAAVFGLTPDLLINRLQGQADQYKTDLAQTSVETRGAATKT